MDYVEAIVEPFLSVVPGKGFVPFQVAVANGNRVHRNVGEAGALYLELLFFRDVDKHPEDPLVNPLFEDFPSLHDAPFPMLDFSIQVPGVGMSGPEFGVLANANHLAAHQLGDILEAREIGLRRSDCGALPVRRPRKRLCTLPGCSGR